MNQSRTWTWIISNNSDIWRLRTQKN